MSDGAPSNDRNIVRHEDYSIPTIIARDITLKRAKYPQYTPAYLNEAKQTNRRYELTTN